jgi:hypothetical protein
MDTNLIIPATKWKSWIECGFISSQWQNEEMMEFPCNWVGNACWRLQSGAISDEMHAVWTSVLTIPARKSLNFLQPTIRFR